MPYIPSAPTGRAADMDYRPAAPYVPVDTGFRNGGAGGDYGGFRKPFGAVDGLMDREFRNMRNAASPPMLGSDLKFRMCPSPKTTKLEPDHLISKMEEEEKNRDLTGQGGLWRGYCYRSSTSEEDIVPAALHGPAMIRTPLPPSTPADPFGAAFGEHMISSQPGELSDSSATSTNGHPTLLVPGTSEKQRSRSPGEPRGLHLLHGLDERLQKEKKAAERNEKIATEFTDDFITQVYNYLSLGFPALARSFDEELSKISRISVEELERDDERNMVSRGHMVEMSVEGTPEEKRCARWRALKVYIYEWARQHPDLDSLDPLAWGVRERRGSWAI
jgi:hypothetical protein